MQLDGLHHGQSDVPYMMAAQPAKAAICVFVSLAAADKAYLCLASVRLQRAAPICCNPGCGCDPPCVPLAV